MNVALHLYLMGLQRRWRDPLLTALTVLLALMLFVIAPLQAAGAIRSEGIGFALIAVIAEQAARAGCCWAPAAC
jgi:hypothetical protein